jgi:hypothetical protein
MAEPVKGGTKIPIPILFKQVENQVIFQGEYMEIMIPENEITRGNTEIIGEKVRTFGVFEMRIWRKEPENPETEKPEFVTRYMYPSKFTTIPSNITYRNLNKDPKDQPDKYAVLIYYGKSIFIDSVMVVKSAEDCVDFATSMFAGFISPVIKYEELVPLLFESTRLNKVSLPINATNLEVVFAAQGRYSKNLSVPYRLFLRNNDNPARSDLKIMKLREVPFVSNSLHAIGFQNFDYAITTSAYRHKRGEKEPEEDDMERIMHY